VSRLSAELDLAICQAPRCRCGHPQKPELSVLPSGPPIHSYSYSSNNRLGHRAHSNQTLRAYAYSLLAFCRWLIAEGIELESVTTDVLLRFLAACRPARLPGRPGPNVVRLDGRRSETYAPATLNHRLAAISSMFEFRSMRDPLAKNPVPKGTQARRRSARESAGMLSHVARRRPRRSALRVREPLRLPRGLERAEVLALLHSLRSLRDQAMAGLMLLCGLRAGEVLALEVRDVDIGGRWLRVWGKGAKERRVPLDLDVARTIQTYLLAERPETTSAKLFVVAKGPNRGQPLSPAGLRTIFRYHRVKPGCPPGIPMRCVTPSAPLLPRPASTWQ